MTDHNGSRNSLKIDKDTLVPLGLVVSCMLAAFGAHTWLDGRLDMIDTRLERIEVTSSNAWTRTDQRLWSADFARQNPTIVVPTVTPATSGGR